MFSKPFPLESDVHAELSNKVDGELAVVDVVAAISRNRAANLATMVLELIQEGKSLVLVELAASDVLVECAKTTCGESNTGNLLAIAPRAILAGSHSVPDV